MASSALLRAIESNEAAEALFNDAQYVDALARFERVFLHFGKEGDPAVRAQVARALYFAVRCNEALGKPEAAAQIARMLHSRFGNDANPDTRRWVEGRADEDEPPPLWPARDPESDNPELDAFLDELLASGRADVPLPSEQAAALAEDDADTADDVTAPLLLPDSMDQSPLDEAAVTLERLAHVFASAYLTCTQSNESVLQVEVDDARVLVTIHQGARLIQMAALWALNSDATRGAKLELANRINDRYVFIRAALHDDTSLIVDTAFCFTHGVYPHQIVHSLRLLVGITRQALADCDDESIVA